MSKTYLVAIAGPSGVGKSEVSKALQTKFKNVEHILLDDYFKNPKTFPKFEEWTNWDLPEDLDFNLLFKNLKKLKRENPVTIPILNKVTLERSKRLINPTSIVLVEGFLVLFDENVRSLFDLKIYIDAQVEAEIKRRLQRSIKPDEGYLRKVVVPNYQKYGLPTKKYADYVVDGNKPLEVVVSEVEEIIKREFKE